MRASNTWKGVGLGVTRSAVARDGYQGPTRERKKREPRAADRRARTKMRGKNISAGAKARERRKKNIWEGSTKMGGSE